MSQRCLLWLGDTPVNNRAVIQYVEDGNDTDRDELLILSPDGARIVWKITDVKTAELLWASIRQTFQALAPVRVSEDVAR